MKMLWEGVVREGNSSANYYVTKRSRLDTEQLVAWWRCFAFTTFPGVLDLRVSAAAIRMYEFQG